MRDYRLQLKLVELRSHVGSGEAIFRLKGFGRSGFRWELLALDEPAQEAVLRSEDGLTQHRAHPRDVVYAPLSPTAARTSMRAKRSLAGVWQRHRPDLTFDTKRYVPRIEDNLIDGVTPDLFVGDLRKGKGNEFRPQKGARPKFHAIHSSSALVVSTFAPWKRNPGSLSLAGINGFQRLRFETPCDIFEDGNPASPDLLAEAEEPVVGLESKFLELLNTPKADFKRAYDSIADERVHSRWYAQIAFLRANRTHYSHLKADQLVKHALGLMYCYRGRRIKLVYLYWEPENASKFPAYDLHRREVQEFASAVADDAVRFVPMTYADLWSSWAGKTAPEWLPEHLDRLQTRYRITI